MDVIFEAGPSVEPQGNKRIRGRGRYDSLSDEEGDSLPPHPPTPADQLCEDELSLIFRNSYLTPGDLLNFRLVSKSWRDAATGALLLRDACSVHVSLHKIQNGYEEEDVDFPYYRDKLSVGSDEDKKMMLTDFVKLGIVMKNSLKFPASKLCIDSPSSSTNTFTGHLDLSLFFVYHRDKIKTVSLRGLTSRHNLADILFLHTPQLECLDLSEATLAFSDLDIKDIRDGSYSYYWHEKVLPFKSLILGNRNNFEDIQYREDYDDIIHQLLSASSNMSCIKGVDLNNLPLVLEEGKAHLVRSFTVTPSLDNFDPDIDGVVAECLALMEQLSEANPKLSELKLDLNSARFFVDTLPSIRKLIESSKDTLKSLSISFDNFPIDPSDKMRIPPMLNLESITLDINCKNEGNKVFSFQDQVAGDKYFPSLVNVTIKRQDSSIKEDPYCFFNKMLGTWTEDEDEDGTPSRSRRDSLPRVETLVLQNCNLPGISYGNCLSNIFSNIRDLRIAFSWDLVKTSGGSSSLSLWHQCPSAELIEIYDIFVSEANRKDADGDVTLLFDVFFTGFSPAMCEKLRLKEFPEILKNPRIFDFLRITPSVCDLEHLKELKMKFSSRSSCLQFASHVTGTCAFWQMNWDTKFVVSYNPIEWRRMQRPQRGGYGQYDTDEDDDGYNNYNAPTTPPPYRDDFFDNDGDDVDESFFGSLTPHVIIVHHHEKD